MAMLGQILEDGQRHEVRWPADHLDHVVDFIRGQAGERADKLRLNALFLALGTHDEITEHLLACRECRGISTFTMRESDAFPPVIQRLGRLDATVARRS
jgi:hypothetical protein